jgi:WD40 repeat protein
VAQGSVVFKAREATKRHDPQIEFINNTQLLISHWIEGNGGRRSVVWDVTTQAPVREISAPRYASTGELYRSQVVSPGGRYRFTTYDAGILIHDISTGIQVATIPLKSPVKGLHPEFVANALTADGKYLYLVTTYGANVASLRELDLSTGKMLERELDAASLTALRPQQPAAYTVRWLLEGNWLITNEAAINLRSGQIVGPLGFPKNYINQVLMLPGDQFLLNYVEVAARNSLISLTPLSVRADTATNVSAEYAALLAPPVVVKPPRAVAAKVDPDPTAPKKTPSAVPEKKLWKSVVDPLKDAKPMVPARQFAISPKTLDKYVTSERGGEFIGIVDEDLDRAQVLSLTTGNPVGVPFKYSHPEVDFAAVDPSGNYFATAIDSTLQITDTATGKVVRCEHPQQSAHCKYLNFAGNQQVAAAFGSGYEAELMLFGAADGKFTKRIILPRTNFISRDLGLCISPGGRYLAALDYGGLKIYDLQGDDGIQQAVLPFSSTKLNNVVFTCDGLQFSPDGTRLAAIYAQWTQPLICIWNMETGEPMVLRSSRVHNHLRTVTHSLRAPEFCWFPGGETLLLKGTILIDAKTAVPYWVLNQDNTTSILPVSSNSMLVIEDGKTEQLRALPLPADVSLARTAVRNSQAEVIWPLSNVNRTPPPIVDNKLVGAPITPDPLATPLRTEIMPFAKWKETEQLGGLEISPAGILAVLPTSTYIGGKPHIAGPLAPEFEPALETYELATGKRQFRIEVPERTRLLDISPDGSLVLTGDEFKEALRATTLYTRLDVWAPQLGKHALGWQPASPERDLLDAAQWAKFIDKRNVLVFHGDTLAPSGRYETHHKLTLWKLPACEAVFSLPATQAPCLSVNRKQFVDLSTGLIRDSFSGKALLQLARPSDSYAGLETFRIVTATFTADGRQLIGCTPGRTTSWIVTWDVSTGKILSELSIPPMEPRAICPLGTRGLLLLNGPGIYYQECLLVDLDRKQFVTRLYAHDVQTVGPDARYWRAESKFRQGYFVKGYDEADFDFTGPAPDYFVLKPGSRLAVEFQTNLPGGEKLRPLLDEKIAKAGHISDPSSSIKLVCTATRDRTVLRAEPPEIAVMMINFRLAIIDGSGAVAWEVKHQHAEEGPLAFDLVKWLDLHGSIPQRLFKREWEPLFPRVFLPPVKP